MSFAEMELSAPILKAIADCGYDTPTPIQAQAIPMILSGRDLMASAQTGTGKTAAFVLPTLQRLTTPSEIKGRGPRVLVLTPTRELAGQVSDAIKTYGRLMRIKSGAVLGGVPYPEQIRMLANPLDILVATPGRLIDHLDRGRLNLSRLEVLILDEADRMLDMGFIDDVEKVAAAAPKERQTLLFTATLDARITAIARKLLQEPETIRIAPEQTTQENIEQRIHLADNLEHKHRLLKHFIADETMTKAIIFSATKRDADTLAGELYALGHSATALHGDMSQGARNRAVANLKRGKVRLLVATDVAARGLDVNGISHVINFDLPKFAEDYVHRIGRTGRAGATGVAISFASTSEITALKRIERYIGQSLPQHVVPGLEPTRSFREAAGKSEKRNFKGKERWQPGRGRDAAPSRGDRPGDASRKKTGAAPRGRKPVVVEHRGSSAAPTHRRHI